MSQHADLLLQLQRSLPVPIEQLPAEVKDAIAMAVDLSKNGVHEPLRDLVNAVSDFSMIPPEFDDVEPEMPLSHPEVRELIANADGVADTDAEFYRYVVDLLRDHPRSVELHQLAGMTADDVEDVVRHFRAACDATQFHDADAVAATMPGYRLKMTDRLIASMRLDDACQVILPVVGERYHDEPLAILRLIDLMLRCGRDDELAGLLNDIDATSIHAVGFARALIEFRRSGSTRRGNALLKAAHDQLPEVVLSLLDQGRETRDDETGATVRCLQYAVRTTPGALSWMRQCLADVLESDSSPEPRWSVPRRPTDEPLPKRLLAAITEEAQSAPQTGQSWQLSQKTIRDFECNQVGIGHIVAVGEIDVTDVDLDIEEGSRAVGIFESKPKPALVREVLLRAIVDPMRGDPSRPVELIVSNKTDLNSLKGLCGKLDIHCRHQSRTTMEKHVESIALSRLALDIADDHRDAIEDDPAEWDDDLDDEFDDDDKESQPFSFGDLKEQTSGLPDSASEWLFGVFTPPMFVGDGVLSVRSRLCLAADNESGDIVDVHVGPIDRPIDDVLHWLQRSMAAPKSGDPRRPPELLYPPSCAELFEEIDDDWMQVADERLDEMFTAMITAMLSHDSDQAPLVSLDHVTPEELRRLYQAAADFYDIHPWGKVAGDRRFVIYDDKAAGSKNRVGVVMGQMGEQFGLNIFDDASAAAALLDDPGAESAHVTGLVINYSEAHEAIPADVWQIERNGWPLAAEEAYPLIARIVHTDHGPRYAAPSADDLKFLSRVLEQSPAFLTGTTDTAVNPSDLHFAWADG